MTQLILSRTWFTEKLSSTSRQQIFKYTHKVDCNEFDNIGWKYIVATKCPVKIENILTTLYIISWGYRQTNILFSYTPNKTFRNQLLFFVYKIWICPLFCIFKNVYSIWWLLAKHYVYICMTYYYPKLLLKQSCCIFIVVPNINALNNLIKCVHLDWYIKMLKKSLVEMLDIFNKNAKEKIKRFSFVCFN